MSIMVKKLYKNGTFLYNMKLIAGRSGMNNLVQWVHIIEDDTVVSFLHGNELVFTAGILNNRDGWLVDFARKLHEARASAFVVNLGPHTKEVPPELIAYCDEIGMPLFTIPWKTRMVDMTRDFCRRIMHNDQTETNLATTIKNILFHVGDFEAQVLQMERYGYQRDSRFCFVSVETGHDSGSEELRDTLGHAAEWVAKSMHELYVSFSHKECLVLVLANYSDEEIETFIRDFLKQAAHKTGGRELHLGISSNQTGIYNQSKNLERAISAMEMAVNLKEPFCYYDRLGIYKVLYAVSDKTVLRSFYAEVIGELETYDRENHTQLTRLLRLYLENNGSLQLVSEKLYIHRNTVTNQLKKIESIVGYDPTDWQDRMYLYLGFYIQDIL